MVIKYLIILLIAEYVVCNSCTYYPSIEQLGCDCGFGLDQKWISCETDNFPKVINELSFSLKYSEDKHFEELYLKSDSLETIDRNFFNNISFKAITFHNCSHLRSIDENAFIGIENEILSFEISGDNQLSDQNIFKVLSKMKNLRILRLSDTKLTSIPMNAFNGSQNYLSKISFDINCNHSPIKRVENRAFYNLINLIHLDISCLQLESIDSNAFEFKSSENTNKLFIDLSNNRLNEQSFGTGFKIQTNRRVDINLNYNPLKHLNQTIFGEFLASDPENSIQFWQNRENTQIDCDSCQTLWLRHYLTQISDTICSDGNRFSSKHYLLDNCPTIHNNNRCEH